MHEKNLDTSKIDWTPRKVDDTTAPVTSRLKPNIFTQVMNTPREIRFAYVKEYLRSTSPKFNTNV